ncbi:putative prophage CPS-53 integrase [compost metagenome]
MLPKTPRISPNKWGPVWGLLWFGLKKAPNAEAKDMSLTDSAIKAAKPQEKPYKLSDAHGLYLLINPNGSKLWKFKYRIAGKEKKLALGAYPIVGLQKARQSREDARQLLAPMGKHGRPLNRHRRPQNSHSRQCRESGTTFASQLNVAASICAPWTAIFSEPARERYCTLVSAYLNPASSL